MTVLNAITTYSVHLKMVNMVNSVPWLFFFFKPQLQKNKNNKKVFRKVLVFSVPETSPLLSGLPFSEQNNLIPKVGYNKISSFWWLVSYFCWLLLGSGLPLELQGDGLLLLHTAVTTTAWRPSWNPRCRIFTPPLTNAPVACVTDTFPTPLFLLY